MVSRKGLLKQIFIYFLAVGYFSKYSLVCLSYVVYCVYIFVIYVIRQVVSDIQIDGLDVRGILKEFLGLSNHYFCCGIKEGLKLGC